MFSGGGWNPPPVIESQKKPGLSRVKGRLKNQITSFKETIAKVLDKDTSLGEKIRTLFREQRITIASILKAIGMAIGVLVEALLLGGGGAAASGGGAAASGGGAAASGGVPPPKDENGLGQNLKLWHLS